MSKLQYSSGLYLDIQELVRESSFIRETFDQILTQNWVVPGLFKTERDISFLNGLVESGSLVGTVKINETIALADTNKIAFVRETLGFELPDDNTWHWLCLSQQELNVEVGVVSVSSDGTLIGVGTKFTEVLRGRQSKAFNAIELSSGTNTQTYSVVEVIDDENAVIAGNFVAETQLTYKVVGAFVEGIAPNSNLKYPFLYDGGTLSLEDGVDESTPPSPLDNLIILARVKRDGAIVSIEDRRDQIALTQNQIEDESLNTTNPLIGIESIKFNGNLTTKEANIVKIGWGMTVTSFTTNSSQRRLTLIVGKGGQYTSTADFVDGDFDNWYVYAANKRHRILSSAKNGTQIDLFLDTLNPDTFNGLVQLTVVPKGEDISFTFVTGTLLSKTITIPISLAEVETELSLNNGGSYSCQYMITSHNKKSNRIALPSGTYLNESAFDADGVLINPSSTTNYTTSIQLEAASDTYSTVIGTVITGDLFGVNLTELNNSSPVVDLQIGSSKRYQLFDTAGTPFSLITDHVISLSTTGVSDGNQFFINLRGDIDLNGNTLTVVQDYVNPSDPGTLLVNFNDFQIEQIKESNVLLRCEYSEDAGVWVVYEHYSITEEYFELLSGEWQDIPFNPALASNLSTPLISGGVPSPDYRTLQYRKEGDRIYLRGSIGVVSGGYSSQTIATLPLGARPTKTVDIGGVFFEDDGATTYTGSKYLGFDVRPNGDIRFFPPVGIQWDLISFEDAYFYLD